MLLPHTLYVIIFLMLTLASASFIIYVLSKIIPRNGAPVADSFRGCALIFLFMFMFAACMIGLTKIIPTSTIIFVGPDKEYSNKTAIISAPSSLIEKYGITDFEIGRNYIINCSDRDMMIYSVTYGNIPIVFDQSEPLIEIPAGKCTWIEPGKMPDFYFEEPDAIQIEKNQEKVQKRLILDYTPITR